MSSIASLPQPSVFVTKEFADIEANARAAGWNLPPDLATAHKSRQTEWLASRLCLTEAFRERGVQIDPAKIRFINHQQIEGEPHFRFSFSHTRERAGCWLVDGRAGLSLKTFAVGLDIESAKRKISEAAVARLNFRFDGASTEIERWCLREAIFKSLAPGEQARFVSLKLVADESGSFQILDSRISGSFHIEKTQDFIAAFAWAAQPPL